MKLLFFISFCFAPLILFSQNISKSIVIKDTIDFEGLLVFSPKDDKLFLIPKEELKKINVFKTTVKKLEKYTFSLPYLQSADFRLLLFQDGYRISDDIELEPLHPSTMLTMETADGNMTYTFVSMDVIELRVDLDFFKEH